MSASSSARDEAATWQGGYRRYDLVKEFVIALVVVSLLTAVLAGVFSSPDKRAVTIAQWSRGDPTDFVTTGLSELNGTSTTATYGPPYNHTSGAGQKIGPVSLQRLAGVRIPVDAPTDLVLHPLQALAADEPQLRAALDQYQSATSAQQQHWTDAYSKALSHAQVRGGQVRVPPATTGRSGR